MRLGNLQAAALILSMLAVTAVAAEPVVGEKEMVAAEPEGELGYGIGTGIFTQYVSRGAVTSNEPVAAVEAWVTYGPLTFDCWNNLDLTNDNFSGGGLTETDWTLEYAFSLPMTECALGYIYYTFPRWHVDDTQELYATASIDTLLNPSFEVYWDFDELGGTYSTASVAYGFQLPVVVNEEHLSLDCSAMVGYGDSNYIRGCFDDVGDGFVDLVIGIEIPIDLGGGFTLTPSVAWMQVLDSKLRECTDKSEALYGGITLTKEL